MQLRGKSSKKRESGILLHISSLPCDYGIGSFGKEAYRFIDFLKKSHQRYWQILPLCPIGEGNSPYKSTSAFAGEILYIDIQLLAQDGYLDYDMLPENYDSDFTEYETAARIKLPLLRAVADNFDVNDSDYLRFIHNNDDWLNDYSVFMAIREKNGGACFTEFEDGLKYRLPGAIKEFVRENKETVRFYKITQYLFYKQYYELKKYAEKKGIKIIGDIPFYVALDSADVWQEPDVFRLGRDMTPTLVAGVPPDIFSEDGQLWGNPIYDWDRMKKDNYKWWRRRLLHNSQMYDVIRIDHFRAFADYYTIPYGSENAKSGTWEKGVGMNFWSSMRDITENLKIIAEDLGGETPEVEQLIEDTGFPNMKILVFAFNTDLQNKFLPKNYNNNCVCYTGTHDNETVQGWLDHISKKEKIIFSRTVPNSGYDSDVYNLISFGMRSKADTVIVPMQDYLCLDNSCRMNSPGTEKGNWIWRMKITDYDDNMAAKIKQLSRGRN